MRREYVRIKSPDEITYEGAIALVAAIARTALNEYKHALTIKSDYVIHDCEEFFRSEYFYFLTGLNGEAIIAEAKKEVREGVDWKMSSGNHKIQFT